MNELDIFSAALEIADPGGRAALLARECGDNFELRQRIAELLESHGKVGSFMDAPAPAPFAPTETPAPITEKPGDTIGPYKLLQQIGEGGMGVVYMAEQTEPVERRVALKIIKPGMDTRQVIARFEAERQALAMMDHPNIARVLDAGTTSTGRPYFVMELVKGLPITRYCDEQHLTTRERLELFLPICQAVQHAHQKGVIHRDLKPSNILIARYDDRAVPKIIDFGVAKAVSHRLTEKTMFTQYGQIVGTIEYMSPEQAQFNQLDVDTRSDVYSLGVLLYELLTGETPFDKQRLRSAAFDELLRIIREEEPPRPSTRLSSSQTLPSIAANRKIEPHRLSTLVRGELDWIVMKALEKDRTRRYETASAFAADVQHYLSDEAVVACPPSAGYRFRKFARRNRATMAVTSAALLVLIVIAVGSSIAAGRFRSLAEEKADLLVAKDAALQKAIDAEATANTARERERLQRVEAQAQTQIATDALADARQQRDRAKANFILARSAVDEFLNEVTENQLLSVPGLQPLRQELLSEALTFYEQFIQDEAHAAELQVELAIAHYRIGMIRRELGQLDDYNASRMKALELFERLRAAGNESLDVRLGLANCYYYSGRTQAAARLYEEILEDQPQLVEARLQLATTYNTLAISSANGDDLGGALRFHYQALAVHEKLAEDFPEEPRYLAELGATVNNIGALLAEQERPREALAMYQRAVATTAQAYDRAPDNILWGEWLCTQLVNCASRHQALSDPESALESLERVVAVRRKLVFENPRVASLKGDLYQAWTALADQQRALGLGAEADRSLRAAEELLTHIGDTPLELFELALIHAVLATPDEDLTVPADADELQHHADLTLAALRRAVDAGFHDTESLLEHPALAVVRERDEFRQLVNETTALELTAHEGQTGAQTIAGRRQAIDVLRELVGEDPTDVGYRKSLAAALHSVGVMQVELQQFDEAEQSLNEALQIRQELRQIDESDLDAVVAELGTRVSLAHLQWALERFPEAHRISEPCLRELRRLAEDHPEDETLQRHLIDNERALCEHYAHLGLWEYASACTQTNLRLRRVNPASFNVDAWQSLSLLAAGTTDDLRSYGALIHERVRQQELTAWNLASIVWPNAILENSSVPPETLVALAKEAVDQEPRTGWVSYMLALARYRDAQYDEALATLEGFPWGRGEAATSPNSMWLWMSSTFTRALLLQSLNRPEEARADFDAAEQFYRRFCRETINSSSKPFPDPIRTEAHWLVYAQQLRRESWRKLHGEDPPDDPWDHLIQARGYRMIGEFVKADRELAAATVAAADDSYALFARRELLSQWGELDETGWTEADWEKLVEQVPDDPEVWGARARWYAEQGDYDQAADDFDRAIERTPAPDSLEQMHGQRPPRRRLYWSAMQWNEVYEVLARLRVDDVFLAYDRVLYLGARSEFSGALQAFGNVPSEHWTDAIWAEYAALLLLNGDRDGYRAACRELERTYLARQDWSNVELKSWVYGPVAGPDSGIDPEILRTVSNRFWEDGNCDANFARAAGLCRLRIGDDAFACVELQRASELQQDGFWADTNLFPLAIAHHHLGNADESREWYDKGTAALSRWQAEITDPESDLDRYHWVLLNLLHREAGALINRTDWQERDWQEYVEKSGSKPEVWAERGRWYAERGDSHTAAADFSRALDLLPAQPNVFAPVRRPYYWDAMRWDDVYRKLAAIRVEDQDLPFERGLYLAARGEFDAAMESMGAGTYTANQGRRQYHVAMVMLLSNSLAEYREFCREAVAGESGPNYWITAGRNMLAMGLAAGTDSGLSPETFQRIGDSLWTRSDVPHFTCQAGACSLRAGRYDEALERLTRSLELSKLPVARGSVCFLLAMAHHHLGNAEESRRWYDEGVQRLRQVPPVVAPESSDVPPYFWLLWRVNYREATELLGLEPDQELIEFHSPESFAEANPPADKNGPNEN